MALRRASLVLIAAGAMCLAVITMSLYIHSLDVFNSSTVYVLAMVAVFLTAISLFLFLHVFYAMTESREKGGEETTNYGRKPYHNCDVCVIQVDGDKTQTGQENTYNFKMSFVKVFSWR